MRYSALVLGLLLSMLDVKAQFKEHLAYGEMLRMKESQIRERMADFPIVEKVESDHEPGMWHLLFQDTLTKVAVRFYFFANQPCHQIHIRAPKRDVSQYIRLANSMYKKREENSGSGDVLTGSDKRAQVSIRDLSTDKTAPEEVVVTIFSK